MRILFLHFPIDNNQIGAIELPNYFATMGHEVYASFSKGDRNFNVIHKGEYSIDHMQPEILKSKKYDLIVCKSDSFQKYGKSYASMSTKIVNIMPMGIKRNLEGVHFHFKENQLIKSPIKEMQNIFKEYRPWKDRENQIIIAASIGSDKNQLEFLNFYNPNDFKDWKIVFAGPVKNINYKNEMKKILDYKKIDHDFIGYVSREELAREILNSKILSLTTDPRPAQPFDPGPRIIFEAIRGGTPCILSDLVYIHEGSEDFCFRYKNNNLQSFNLMMGDILSSNLEQISIDAYSYGEKNYTIEHGCKKAYTDIMEWYSSTIE